MSRTKGAAAALVADPVRQDPDKAARVEQERARILALFAGADANKLDFIQDAVQQVAWLGITILELQAEIDERGPVVQYQNGRDQTGLQANPACKILKDYQQLYNTAFRSLLPLVPEGRRGYSKLDEFRREFDEVAAQFNCDDDLPLDTDNI